ncbi:hypothetical protein VDGD_08563 [Verticillium dahliae]|nr:hypothetical protein VDGD_08563 [Verticillium dahliae]
MPVFEPDDYATAGTKSLFEDESGASWEPVYQHDCSFNTDFFNEVMMNMIKNPNVNTKWLFRADILHDTGDDAVPGAEHQPQIVHLSGYHTERALVRRLVPRNPRRDNPLDQTCLFLQQVDGPKTRTVVLYLPHESSADDMPFYHPKVRGIAQLHEWDADEARGTISIHYWHFPPGEHGIDPEMDPEKLKRTARMLLSVLHKHGQGQAAGYVKKVHHDVVIPQARFQDRYSALKLKHAARLVSTWAEVTDPLKHVFEDLGIAAFLIELWADMYRDQPFPGFVDIGCGNGLLVHILLLEGYAGWGFDARERKSWATYGKPTTAMADADADAPPADVLKRLVLLPDLAAPTDDDGDDGIVAEEDRALLHDGTFPKGTFIISNHADELTPWTPILATLSASPFIAIPCCSHDLGGAKYRAAPPRDKTKSASAFSSLVDWVSRIAEDCGWQVETEMLRIPSTRNTALLGRTRTTPAAEINARQIVDKYGGTAGYYKNAINLTRSKARGH